MLNKKMRIVSILLSMVVILSACGKSNIEVPELLAPLTTNESFRPVSKEYIGGIDIQYGEVVPLDYCYFWNTGVMISEVFVEIGDYVEAGETIAIADIENAKEGIEELRENLSLLEKEKESSGKIYTLKREALIYQLQEAKETANVNAINSTNIEISVLDENNRYSNLMFDLNSRNINKQIEELNEVIMDGSLVAIKSGYVTFAKDINVNNMADRNENVIIISDYDDRHILLQDITLENDIYDRYKYIAMKDGNEYYEVETYDYTPSEMIAIEVRKTYPNARLKLKEKDKMPELGSVVPIFMFKQEKKEVLSVGIDSLFEDNKGTFVYVKTENAKEVRYIETGRKDLNYAEVLSGLEEGEMVFYSSGELLPTEYSTHTVSNQDFNIFASTQNYSVTNIKNISLLSEHEGMIKERVVANGDVVKKGDLLFTIKTNNGNAKLTEMQNKIDNLKKIHEDSVADFDEQNRALYQEIIDFENYVPEEILESTPTDASEDNNKNTYSKYFKEKKLCEINILQTKKELDEYSYNYNLNALEKEYNKINEGNDGSGIISVYASVDGEIYNSQIENGAGVKEGELLLMIKVVAENQAMVRTEMNIPLNQTVEFIDKTTGDTFSGKVIGNTGIEGKVYITTRGEEVFISTTYKDVSKMYFVKMDDESFFDKQDTKYTVRYPEKKIPNAIVVHNQMVHYEFDKVEQLYKTYVWKLQDGELVKQYVTIYQEYGNDKVTKDVCIIDGLSPQDVIVYTGDLGLEDAEDDFLEEEE